jgi:hypothetical protein
VPAHHFGIFMSVSPVLAVLVGMVILGQHLDVTSWAAVAVIVTANVVAVMAPRPRSAHRRPARDRPSGGGTRSRPVPSSSRQGTGSSRPTSPTNGS